MEKLNRAAKCSILGPQNLGSGGGPGPRGPPLDPRLLFQIKSGEQSVLGAFDVEALASFAHVQTA